MNDNGNTGDGASGEHKPGDGPSGEWDGKIRRLVGTMEESKLDPYEIDFLPQFTHGRGPRQPFVNEYGVVIGDHEYDSPQSPLNNWSDETDPAIMAGEQWVHPYKDIGFHTAENRAYFEKGMPPQGTLFTHPVHDVTHGMDKGRAAGAKGERGLTTDGEEGPLAGEVTDVKDGGGCRE